MHLYLITALLYFWLPVALLAPWLLPRLDALSRRAFFLSLAVFYPLASVMEYVYLHYDIWTFSERTDRLVGVRIFGAPIEEFVYWFGATPFALLVYFAFCRLFPLQSRTLSTPSSAAPLRRRHTRRISPPTAVPSAHAAKENPALATLFER